MRPFLNSLLLLSLLFLGGCSSELTPYLGHWDGEFVVEKAIANQSDLALRGYVQLYQTGDRFLAEMANPSQKVTLKGTWKLVTRGARANSRLRTIELDVKDLALDELPLESLKVLGHAYLEPQALREKLSRTIILTLDPDGHSLEGVLTTIGPLLGHFHFVKGNTRIGPQEKS